MFYIVLLLWLLLDQWSKYWIMNHFLLGESVALIPGLLHGTYILNRGAAFGILADQRLFFFAVVGILCLAYWYYRRTILEGSVSLRLGAALLLSGAIGNALDRYFYHGVVDFIDFRIWPIFNVADIGICVGVLVLAWHVVRLDDRN